MAARCRAPRTARRHQQHGEQLGLDCRHAEKEEMEKRPLCQNRDKQKQIFWEAFLFWIKTVILPITIYN